MAEPLERQPRAAAPEAAIPGTLWKLLAALMTGTLLGALDISIVSPALPVIARELHVGARDIPWLVTVYLLVYIVATPLMSALSDRLGRRTVFLLDLLLFGCGSLMAALAPSFAWLLSARGIQAMGAGGIFPLANTVIGESFPPHRRGMALGFVGMVWGAAAIIGPLLGGWITQWLGYRFIFYFNLPLVAAALWLAVGAMPREPGRVEWHVRPEAPDGESPGARRPLDVPGLVPSEPAWLL